MSTFPLSVSGPILYQLHQGQTAQAVSTYTTYAKESGEVDYTLLQQAASRILEQGASSDDPESMVMALFGAGVASSPELIPILERGLKSPDQRSQLVALSFLAKLHDDRADKLIGEALSSPSLLTRLEAALALAQKGDRTVVGHLETLFGKVPPFARPLFAQIVAPLETREATLFMRRLLADANVEVRLEAIREGGKAGRDDLLPQIRSLLHHPDHRLQEAAALALGKLQDESALEQLEKLSEARQPELKLAAHCARYRLGVEEALSAIVTAAEEGDLFALTILGEERVGLETLAKQTMSEDENVRLNAALGLLLAGDGRSLPVLKEILVKDARDLGYTQVHSPGRSLGYWKVVPSHSAHSKDLPLLKEQTHGFREKVLRFSLELPHNSFVDLATTLFERKETPLIPLLVQLLKNEHSPAALALLKTQQQKAGAPFIRTYCTLALYQMQEEGPYEEQLIRFARQEGKHALIRFKEEKKPKLGSLYTLNPEETSALLIDTFETLAAAQSPQGIEALLHAIAHGNPKNKYALAGLLMRTAE